MRKFILIDHSISGAGGHYLEYAVNVLREAEKTCETYLVTNQKYQERSTPHAKHTYALYAYDIWGKRPGTQTLKFDFRGKTKQLFTCLKNQALFSELSFFLMGFKTGKFFMTPLCAKKILIICEFILLALLILPFALIYFVLRLVAKLLGIVGRWIDRAVKLPAGLTLKTGCTNFFKILRRKFETQKGKKTTKAFYRGTLKTIHKAAPKSGDVIFIPTLSLADTEAVYQILKHEPEAKTLKWFLLYRRNLYDGRNPEYANQINSKAEWRKVFSKFIEYENVNFLTDTQELTDQYNTLGVLTFKTAPIPMNPAFQDENLEITNKPFQIVYAGDARSEKGYQHFPWIAEKFAIHGNVNNVSFLLQSNFTFKEVRNDPSVVLARNILDTMQSPTIKLIKQAVTSEQYFNLVSNASVMPLLYNRDNYYARSSGALAEALAVAIPVVVPSASWLSNQIMPMIIKDQLALQKTNYPIFSKSETTTGWYVHTDIYKAKKLGNDKKKHNSAYYSTVPTLINLQLIRSRLQRNKSEPLSQSRLAILGTQHRPTNLYQIPEDAKSVFLKFQLDTTCGKGVYVRTTVSFFNQYGWEISCHKMDHSRYEELDGICTDIAHIPNDACYIQIELSCPYGNCYATCLDFHVEFWKEESFALGGNGCVYVDEEDIYNCLREIQQYWTHYYKRAKENAKKWNAFHSAENLVKLLLDKKEEPKYDS